MLAGAHTIAFGGTGLTWSKGTGCTARESVELDERYLQTPQSGAWTTAHLAVVVLSTCVNGWRALSVARRPSATAAAPGDSSCTAAPNVTSIRRTG